MGHVEANKRTQQCAEVILWKELLELCRSDRTNRWKRVLIMHRHA